MSAKRFKTREAAEKEKRNRKIPQHWSIIKKGKSDTMKEGYYLWHNPFRRYLQK